MFTSESVAENMERKSILIDYHLSPYIAAKLIDNPTGKSLIKPE